MAVTIYNIWHQRLFPELLQDVPKDERKHVVLMGVNECIPKETPDVVNDPSYRGYQTLMEYRLPFFEPNWQDQGYCQTSCMYHLHENRMHMEAGEYIGFMQYDMQLFPDTIRSIRETICDASERGKRVIFLEKTITIGEALVLGRWEEVLVSYNQFFGTNWTWRDLVSHPRASQNLAVHHTFVMPGPMFHKMMSWMNHYLRSIQGAYPTYISQAEYAERIHGLFLCIEMMTSEDVEIAQFKLAHQWPIYHDKVPFKNYKKCV